MKNILIISSSPRHNSNSYLLAKQVELGAKESGNNVSFISLKDKKIDLCLACDYCMKHRFCHKNDDMKDIIKLYQEADIVVFATPVYFYGISSHLKVLIDRMYPIWQNLGKKDIYYIISAGLDESIINRSLSDLDGFVEHLEEYEIKGRLYATNVMDTGLVKDQKVYNEAYIMGKNM